MIQRQLIYDGTQEDFFHDVRQNQLATKMKQNFEEHSGRRVSKSEYASWIVSGDKIKNLLESANVSDITVSFEYQVPYTQKRIDCLLFGKGENNVERPDN